MTLFGLKNNFSDFLSTNKLEKKKIFFFFLLGVTFFLLTFILFRKIDYYFGEAIKIGIAVFSILFISINYKKVTALYKAVYLGILLSITFTTLQYSFKLVEDNFIHLKEWDFLCFYMDGNVAARGLNFYEPQNYADVYKQIEIPFTPSPEFVPETINVAFQYFPPNIFNFLFLGYLDFNTAHVVWIALSTIFLLVDIFLIWKLFFINKKLLGLIISALLVLLLPGTISSLVFEHNTFMFLLPVLLFWKYKDSPYSGILLAVAMFLKPIFLIYMLYPLARRKWKMLITSATASLVIILITYLVFGSDIFTSFITKNTGSIVPYWVYTEWTNQSLLGTILRITDFNFDKAYPLFHPLYVSTGLIIAILSLLAIYKINKQNDNLALGIISSIALIIYPGTQPMYSPILIPLILLIYNLSSSDKINYLIWLLIISFIYSIMLIIPFISYFLIWIIIMTFALFKTGVIHSEKISTMNFSLIKSV